jgi:CMP-N-acetylneuraminic acid synthetase
MTPMKAIEPVKQHPGKMWRMSLKGYMRAFSSLMPDGSHLLPTQRLEPIYVQNASLEFINTKYIAIVPAYQSFFTEGFEGFDINTELDFMVAEMLVEKGLAKPPQIRRFSI